MKPFTSVCVLSYERPAFLKACLETVRDAGGPIELIVHDDGSEDIILLEFLHEMQERGQISTLILNPPGHNQGVGEAVRRCFAVAQGDVLVKVDQDLCFAEGWEPKVRTILEDELVGIAGGFAYHTDPVDIEKTRILGLDAPEGHFYVTDFVGSVFALRREVYERFGPIETHSAAFAEDITLKERITGSTLADAPGAGGLFCALPDEDICINVGFGVGPSTVVIAPNTVRSIHREPLLYGS